MIAAAAWAVILLAAFLANRGSDVGKLSSLARGLGGGPLFGEEFFDGLVGLVAACLVLQAWIGLGRVVGLLVPDIAAAAQERSLFLKLAIDAAIGAALWSLVWFFLGLLGLYSAAAAIAATLAGNVLLFVTLRREHKTRRADLRLGEVSSFQRLLVAMIALPLLLTLVAALAPPIAKDTLLYHYALPKAYIAQHSNAIVEGNIASYLPLGGEMHFVWAMLVGGLFSDRAAEAAAGGVSFWFFAIVICAVYGWCRSIALGRSWSLIAALAVASIPTAYHVAASGYIDVALALNVTLAVFAISRWWREPKAGWLVLVAIFLSAALAMKLTSIFIVAAFALIVLIRARKAKEESADAGRLLAFGLGALIAAGLLASPWYLRTWKETGSPVFPFYMSIWKGTAPGWDVERSDLFQAMNSQYGGENKTAADFLLSPLNVSVTAQPEYPQHFDGVIGVAFLFGLPLLIFALWKFEVAIDVKIAVVVAGVTFLFWLSSSQQLRYLLPVLPALAVAIVAASDVVSQRAAQLRSIAHIALVAASAAGILTIAAWFLKIAPLRVVLGGETRDAYLARNLDYYHYYQWLNSETGTGDKVWLINMRRDTYHLDRPAVSDYLFEDWTLRQMVWESRSLPELRAKAASMGVRYVLARHDFLFDYDRSTLVDDKRPRAENEAKLKMSRDFILDTQRTVKADDRFSLIRVF